MSKISVREAAILTGTTRETINKATNNGTLNYSHNAQNHKVIDISELERVYKLVVPIEELSKPKPVRASQPSSESDVSAELATLREKLSGTERTNQMLVTERERERRQLESEIDNLRSSLEKSQEQHSKAMLLITDQSSQSQDQTGEWEESIRQFEKRLANHEDQAKTERRELKEKATRRINRLQQALNEEKSKSFLQKLFG